MLQQLFEFATIFKCKKEKFPVKLHEKIQYLLIPLFRGNYSGLNWKIVANVLLRKHNFCCGNYSKEEAIQGQKLYEEIR